MKPRLLIILNRLSIGGPAANTLALAARLSFDYEILLVAGKPGTGEHSAEHLLSSSDGFRVEFLEEIRREVLPLQDIKTYCKLRKIIRSFKPHIVHTHGSKPGALGRLAAWQAGVPVIVHTYHGHVFHSYFSKPVSGAIIWLERWLAKRTSLLLAINQKLKTELEITYRIAPAEKIVLNRLGVQAELLQDTDGSLRSFFRSQWQLEENEMAVAIVGRLVQVKQHRLFLQMALQLLTKQHAKKYRFFIVGDGEEKGRLLELVRQSGSSLRSSQTESPADFTFTSWQTNMGTVLSGIDILVLTSLNEGTPVSILEAMGAGKPVVATPVGGIPELFLEAGVGFTATTAEELANAVHKLAMDPELRAQQGSLGASYIQHHLSISSQAAALSAIFQHQLKQQ